MPSRFCSSSNRFRICAWIETSRAETGSSAMIRLGSTASARAMLMRWRWPPLKACGSLCLRVGAQADDVEKLLDPASIAARPILKRWTRSTSPSAWPDRQAGIERRIGVLEHHLYAPRQARADRDRSG